ncbi:hypothetical protein LXL04_012441 [Taraxacum kok-saghyz]
MGMVLVVFVRECVCVGDGERDEVSYNYQLPASSYQLPAISFQLPAFSSQLPYEHYRTESGRTGTKLRLSGPSPTSKAPTKHLGLRTESDIRGKFLSLRLYWADRVRGKRSNRVRGPSPTDIIKRTDHGPSPWSESESVTNEDKSSSSKRHHSRHLLHHKKQDDNPNHGDVKTQASLELRLPYQ